MTRRGTRDNLGQQSPSQDAPSDRKRELRSLPLSSADGADVFPATRNMTLDVPPPGGAFESGFAIISADLSVTGCKSPRGLAQRGVASFRSPPQTVLRTLLLHSHIMSARGPLVIADANSELHPVVDAFTKFLTVATHQILHAHNIYPARTFIRAKDYGLEIYQSRHPDVCKFVNNEIADIRRTILSGTVKRIFVAIFVQGLPREHFVFDITRMSKLKPGTIGEEAAFETPLPLVDAEEQMRAVLSKLEVHCTSLKPLNDPGTFRMIMEVDDGSRFSPDNEEEPNTHPGDDPCTEEHAVDMVKIRSVEAGRFVFDLWYEPARTLPRPSTDTPHHPLASDGSASSSSSDPYIPFPSTRVELKDK